MRVGFGLKGHEKPRARKRTPKAETPERSAAYLDFIRSQPCIVSGARAGIEAHHFAKRGSKAMGAKVSDFSTVPLHRIEHAYWHSHGTLRGMTRAESEALMLSAQDRLRKRYEASEEP